MATRKIFGSFVLFCVFHIIQVLSQECISPLGMADGRIKDSQITVSSFFKTAYGGQARLRQNIPMWGAWCPDVSGGKIREKNYDQYIQIDLLNLTKITRIATQGREYNGGTEWVQDYKLSYRKDGEVWYYYRGKDQAVKIFRGNNNVFSVVRHDLDPTIIIMARYIRVHPGYDTGDNVCMRLELYGCVAEKVILSYSMLVGQITKNGKVHYKDTSYNGVITNGFYKGGTGILTDGKFGPVDARVFQGEGWVGWCYTLTQSQYIDITFEFSGVRKFKDVTLTVNINKKRNFAVVNKSQIFFSSSKTGFSDTSFLQYCPRYFQARNDSYNAHVILSLCENTARFVKLRLYFGGEWLLISEISFNSVPASTDETMKDCSGNTAAVCTATQLSTGNLPTTYTPIPACESCTTPSTGTDVETPAESSSGSSNLQLTIIIVCVILLIVIVLLVVIFLLYRRRALCFGKMKQRNKTVRVELQNVEDSQEPAYDTINDNVGNPEYSSVGGNHDDTQHMLFPVKKKSGVFVPKTGDMQNEMAPVASQNNQEPDYSPADDETEPYEEVQISPSSVYAEPDRNRQDETTNDGACRKLSKRQSDLGYVIPADGSPSSVYAELNRNRQDETTNDGTYQKLLKRNSDYVIPAHTEAESFYEEVGKIKTPPGYKELDNTKRVQDDSADYQKLIKK